MKPLDHHASPPCGLVLVIDVIPVDTIICCSAGYGLRQEPPSQFIFARMLSVFSAVFDRAQNASMHRLHEAKRSGQIKSFILPYLGQRDRELPNPPADLVRREEAHSYPTDFSAMPDEWIERLSLRGEQLTLCLARAYIPDLIREAGVGVSGHPDVTDDLATAKGGSRHAD
jgi:NTE family protein